MDELDLFPRCTILPLPDDQVSLRIDGVERTRWHFGAAYPRPFFYPLLAPNGHSVTRMGHPGAPNHDHHRSVWFAHADLLGRDFWSENGGTRIAQPQWYAYQDGDEQAVMGVELRWLDGHDPRPLLQTEVAAAIAPIDDHRWTLELQLTLGADAEGVEFRKSDFGLLGVRVAKSISAHFGGGTITGADGRRDEPDLFGQPNRWLDYSGPVAAGSPESSLDSPRFDSVAGVTVMDHPSNQSHPAHWHVRRDGWIGPSLSRHGAVLVSPDRPLVMRYLLLIHDGPYDPQLSTETFDRFAASAPWQRRAAAAPHLQWAYSREGE